MSEPEAEVGDAEARDARGCLGMAAENTDVAISDARRKW
jgi:hypothetical protein